LHRLFLRPISIALPGVALFQTTAAAYVELGIDVQGIFQRSLAVLTNRLSSSVLQDLDLGGPLFFAAILGSVHLLVSHGGCLVLLQTGRHLDISASSHGLDCRGPSMTEE
jgi:hypothetical protein